MPNPAVTFKPSGPPGVGEGVDPGPLPVIKVDLTPPTGRTLGETPPEASQEPQKAIPKPQPRPNRLIDDIKRYRRQAWESRQLVQELQGQLQQANDDAAWARSVRAMPKEQRVRLASELGLTYDDFTQAILKGERPVDPVSEEVAKTKEELASLRTELQEERKQAAEATFRASIQRHVISNPQRYPWIRRYADMGSMDEVYDVVRLSYEKFGEHVSIKRASRMVEGYLDKLATRTRNYFEPEPARSDGQRMAAPRPQGENGASRAPTRGNGAPAMERGGMSSGPRARTPVAGLSNRMTPSAATFDRSRPARNDAERDARALAILRGQIPA